MSVISWLRRLTSYDEDLRWKSNSNGVCGAAVWWSGFLRRTTEDDGVRNPAAVPVDARFSVPPSATGGRSKGCWELYGLTSSWPTVLVSSCRVDELLKAPALLPSGLILWYSPTVYAFQSQYFFYRFVVKLHFKLWDYVLAHSSRCGS